jgi:mono/diheme cytochrome c family protein
MHLQSLALAGIVSLSVAAAAGAQTAGTGKTAEENYKAVCQPCHMADGNAALKPMNFADGEWKHGTTPQELAKVIANGVPGTAMMPFKTRFSEQEILELAKYVRHFDPKLKSAPPSAAKKGAAPAAKKKPAAQ